MQLKQVTKDQIMSALIPDIELLVETIANAMNNAQWGHIIDQTEEPVRDAHAQFRQQAYQKALGLLAESQKSFSRCRGKYRRQNGGTRVSRR